MNNFKQYHVLWIDDDFREGTLNHSVLVGQLGYAKDDYPDIEFQTCIYGNDFLRLANQENPWTWDAFVIDYNGMMEEGGDVRDILAELMAGLKNKETLLYCLSGHINEEHPTVEDGFLKSEGFQENPKTAKFFFSKDDVELCFEDLHEALELKYGKYKDYPELRVLHDAVQAEGKALIDQMLDWGKDKSIEVDYKQMRSITKPIELKLRRQGFFGENKSKSFQGYIDWGPGGINDPDCLSLECRTKWEAQAMAYLFSFANIAAGHPERYGYQMPKPGTDGFDTFSPFIKEMIFDALIVFSKWYVRFEKKLKEKGGNMSLFFNNPLINTAITDDKGNQSDEEKPGKVHETETKKTDENEKEGNIGMLVKKQSKKKEGRFYWAVEIDMNQSILVDWVENKNCESIGENVPVSYRNVFKDGIKLATNIQTI